MILVYRKEKKQVSKAEKLRLQHKQKGLLLQRLLNL